MKQQKKFTKKASAVKKITDKKQQKEYQIPKRNHILLWSAIIILITTAAYFPAFQNGITNWDDDSYITNNPTLKEISAENIKQIFSEYYMGNYHPLVMFSLSLDYQIGGENADGEIHAWIYHFTNILLHILNTLLVLWLVYLLLGRFDIAVAVALLFGVHTLHVESVAWISERKDVLYALFFISSLISYIYYINKKDIKFYTISLLLFVLSLLSKGQAVSLAVTLLAIDYLFNRKLLDKKVIAEKTPYFILALIFGIVAIYAQKAGDALHDENSYEFYKRIGFAGYTFTQYILKLILPVKLAAIYPYPDILNKSMPAYFWLFLAPTLSVLYAFYYFVKRNKLIAFSIAFFTINIALLLQLIPVGSAIMADRYAYIPSIGFFIFIAWGIFTITDKYPKQAMLLKGVLAVYLVVLVVLSVQRSKIWEDNITLWDDTLEKSPKAVVAWNNRGSTKDKDKDHKGAIEDFTRAILYKPDYKHAFYNRGTARKELGKEINDTTLLILALNDFNKAIELDEYFVEAYNNRAMVKENMANYIVDSIRRNTFLNIALADYDITLELDDGYENAIVNRGVVKGKLGQLDEAINDFNQAILKDPKNASAYSNRGLAKDHAKDTEGAIADYNMAIEIDPEFITAYLNRGIVYRKQKSFNASIADFSKVLSLDDKQEAAYYFRGMDLIQINKLNEGCRDLNKAKNLGYPYAQSAIDKFCKD
ncbi:MAG: tetratricopeptide repeat protein [Bacteroidota bacterium]